MCSVIKFYIASCYAILKIIIIFYLVLQYTYVNRPKYHLRVWITEKPESQLVELHNIT